MDTLSATESRHALEVQIGKIRAEIRDYGESIVGPDQLRILYDGASIKNEWNALAAISIKEGWSFTMFPAGSIRFAQF